MKHTADSYGLSARIQNTITQEDMMFKKNKITTFLLVKLVFFFTLAGILLSFNLSARTELMGKFKGQTIKAKLIGGGQYERLYQRINKWEKRTGAKVKIISKKNHFELDKELKSDIASGSTDWCVGSNHSSFAPLYSSGLYENLNKLIKAKYLKGFNPSLLKGATLKGNNLQLLPRAQFDVSVTYYQKSLYASKSNQRKFKKKFGYKLMPPDTLQQFKDQAIFFSNPPNLYGTQYAGKEEAIVGRFYEILVAEGGTMFDKDGRPKFNSAAGQRALKWFVDLYKAGAVPKGTLSYLWDDLGSGFASGTVAINLDWPGWAGYFNDKKESKVAGNLGIVVQPKGSSGKRTGWSGFHGFSVTKTCKNKKAAASLVWYLTSYDSQVFESAKGSLPTRTKVWDVVIKSAKKGKDKFRVRALKVFKEASKHAFPVPAIAEWIEATNIIYPELQSAILGDKTIKVALKEASDKVDEMMEESGAY